MTTKTQFGYIKPKQLEEEMRSSYLTYAMSVIVSRALPDVRDGLKPVQRRILYAMHGLGMRSNSSYKKSARLVGEVLGKYHPHGDSSVYDAMVRMAQPFSLRIPLVDGQGNFGSVDNDPPAAMRYTEARLSSAAEELLVNLDQETVDFSDNFDSTLQEPVVLPARLPNLLLNGASGIAVGMATNIPPHNLSELCDGIYLLLKNPDATADQLMKRVLGPDFPTGSTIMGTEGIRNAYETGRGQIVVRATAGIEPMKRSNRMQIIVTELPYQVNKATLIEKIAGLIKNKRLDGISELRDESDRRGMRIVMELRSGVQGLVILNNLYKFTTMQSSFSANMLAIVDGTPQVVTLRTALLEFIKFRRQVITRRSEFELKRAQARSHILDGLRIALANLDSIIALIRGAADAEAAKTGLMTWYDLSDLQAQAILDMQLRRIAALERERIETEYKELQKTIRDLEELLANPDKIDAEIKSETVAIKKKHGDERRTIIGEDLRDFKREDLEAHEQVVVTLSKGGYIKRILASTYRNQHRGGKGVSSMRTKDDDPVRHILVGDTHDTLLFFTNTGRVLPLRSFELRADTSRNTRGVPVVNVIPLTDKERVNAIIGVSSLKREALYLVMATRGGSVKRVELDSIANIRRAGLIIMNLRSDDELVTARLATEEDDIMMVTEQGMSIRFRSADVTARQRAAGGVRGILLRGKDRIVAMDIVDPDSKLLVISKKGFGKLTYLKSYRLQGRGGSGIKTLNVTRRTGTVAAAEVIADSDQVYLVSTRAQVLRTSLSEIRSTGRATQGVTIFKMEPGDSVTSIACVKDFDETEDATSDLIPSATGQDNGGTPNGNITGA
jgi:DNA gyrase subunit A